MMFIPINRSKELKMRTRDYKVLRSILMLRRAGIDCVTAGEVSRATRIPETSVRRILIKMEKLKATNHTEFKRNRLTCKDWYLTPSVGLQLAQNYVELF